MAASNLLTSGLTIPPAAALNAAAAPRGLAAAGARSLVPLIYGRDRVPASILNVLAKAGDASIVLVQCLWGHALDAVEALTFNDQALPTGTTATHYTGGQTTADAALVAAFSAQGIAYSDTLAGFAYSVVALPASAFDGQLNLSALVRGRRVYDPRADSTAGGSGTQRLADPTTWVWSPSPALALADWLASTLYGAGTAVAWATVGPAATANESTVGSPAEPRRQIGLTLARDGVSVAALAETLRAYAGCWLVPGAAGLRLLPDADTAPVASYSHAAGQIAELLEVNLRDLGDSPTAVEIQFTDTTQVPWREASATAVLPGAGTTLPWRLSTVAMPGVQRYSQAYREAVERLNKLTLGNLSLSLEVFDEGLRHEQADIVTVAHPLGLTDKPMRVMGVEMTAPGRWLLELTEHDPASYSSVVQTAPSIPDTTRAWPVAPPALLTGLTATPVAGGVALRWNASQERYYSYTELRDGPSWAAGAFIWSGAANSHTWAPPPGATLLVWAAHYDISGAVGPAASVAVTIAPGTISGLSAAFIGPDLRLDYVDTPGTFLIEKFEIRYGATWAGATAIGDYKVTRLDRRVDWLGLRRWWVAAVDTRGTIGTPVSIDVTVTEPGAVTAARSEIVDNNVLLYWSPPATGSLPVERYEVRKGSTWAGGAAVGSNGNSTFATVFEQQAGAFSYWVAAFDSAGNIGMPVAITATVSQPPDYVLRANYDDDFTAGAPVLSGMYLDAGKVYGPALLETIQTHFESRAWATPDAQIAAGFPLVFQPSGTSGYYERALDYFDGAPELPANLLPATVITATPITATLSGDVTMTLQVSYKATAAGAWIDGTLNASQVLASSFRYIKVRVTFTAAGGEDLVELSALNIKLSSKLKTDSGSGTAVSTDAGGTPVAFGAGFIDVSSIVVTPSGTDARYGIYDFVDTPNPTSFKVLLFNSAGARVSGAFSWTARGF